MAASPHRCDCCAHSLPVMRVRAVSCCRLLRLVRLVRVVGPDGARNRSVRKQAVRRLLIHSHGHRRVHVLHRGRTRQRGGMGSQDKGGCECGGTLTNATPPLHATFTSQRVSLSPLPSPSPILFVLSSVSSLFLSFCCVVHLTRVNRSQPTNKQPHFSFNQARCAWSSPDLCARSI